MSTDFDADDTQEIETIKFDLRKEIERQMDLAGNPMLTTVEITNRVYGFHSLDSNSREYRNVLRMLNTMYSEGKVWCKRPNGTNPCVWLLKARVMYADGLPF